MSDDLVIELKAEHDEGVIGEGRKHYVFPARPKSERGALGALLPPITGGVWILRGHPIPNKIIIKLI